MGRRQGEEASPGIFSLARSQRGVVPWIMRGNGISRCLTSPKRVAQALEWKKLSGSILTVAIDRDRLDLAVASHPATCDLPEKLPPVPVKTVTVDNQKVLKRCALLELSAIIKDFHVCGIVVSWPVQPEGWCGFSAGKVMHILDQLSVYNVLTDKTPVCLWDEQHRLPQDDKWGRSPIYCLTTRKLTHRASQEQYEEQRRVAALRTWNDFSRSQWPDLYDARNYGVETEEVLDDEFSSS